MDPKRVPQRPNMHLRQPAPVASQQPTPAEARLASPSPKPRNKKWLIIIASLVILLGIAYCALYWLRVIGPMSGVKTDKYQAIFLANNPAQVYFGKITSITDDTVILKEAYFIKSENQNAQSDAQQSQQNQAVLTKIDSNSELHKPYNEMRINRDQILFWENLQDDSKIVQTIKSSGSQ